MIYKAFSLDLTLAVPFLIPRRCHWADDMLGFQPWYNTSCSVSYPKALPLGWWYTRLSAFRYNDYNNW